MGNKLIRDRGQSAGRSGLCDLNLRQEGLQTPSPGSEGQLRRLEGGRQAERLRGNVTHTGSTAAEASRPRTRQTLPRQKGPVQGPDWVRESVPVLASAPEQGQDLRPATMSWDSGPSRPRPRGLGCECKDLCCPSQGPRQMKCDLCCEHDIHTGF